jgi:SAM-dependent methyltransferase
MEYNKQAHFLLEKSLADKLRISSAEERRVLYQQLYNELFTQFPNIPEGLNISKEDRLAWQLRLLSRFFDKKKTILEIGAGDCLLSKELAKHFGHVTAYEVADSIPFIEGRPDNFELRIFNGVDMAQEDASVDIVYSNQVFEHLHTDDTEPLLQAYHRFLRSDGLLMIITPHRLTGPHDISREFTPEAEGFHMKEYTYSELSKLLRKEGFTKVRGYIGYSKIGYFPVIMPLLILMEKMYGILPGAWRRKIRGNTVIFNLFGIKLTARKKVNKL